MVLKICFLYENLREWADKAYPPLGVSTTFLMKQGRKMPIQPWQFQSVELNFNGCSFQLSKI